ncbi:MAG TPA: homoserine kinase [Pseudonocardiaceae bacterium]|nr:homoserine kinase [Pseudonocardiaceae bacterium]
MTGPASDPLIGPASGAGVRVTVPASTANLGSGFDALGMALALYDTVDVRVTASGLAVAAAGCGAETVPTDESHLIVRALRTTCGALGIAPPGLDLRCHNAIPHARGLGSSAAAVVAGVAAGYALAGRPLDAGALQLAGGMEGHADNAAASLYGGAVIAWQDAGRYRAVRLDPHPSLRPIVLVPDVESATKTTRGLLPERVPHADAAFAAGRAALAVHALTVDPTQLLPATADRLHQDYREAAWPATSRLVRLLRSAGVAAAVSGAGPTVLALTTDGQLPPDVDPVDLDGFTVLELAVDRTGVRVEPLGATAS